MISELKSFLPQTRPNVPLGLALRLAQEAHVDLEHEVCIIGLRGFYNPNSNQRAIYDDAICFLAPHTLVAFNANTDPGAYRKHIANLIPGVWSYKLGIHGLSKPKSEQYQALVQDDEVIVHRDQEGLNKGFFGINIHRGGWTKVSSLGCQTIHPRQWEEFIGLVKLAMKQYKQSRIKYILRSYTGETI